MGEALQKKGNKMYRFIIASLAFLWIGTSHAMIINDFTGQYSASNWSIGSSGGGITVDNSDPTILRFLIENSGDPQPIDSSTLTYQIIASGTGIVSFDWRGGGFFPQSTLGNATILAGRELVFSDDIDIVRTSFGHIDAAVTAGELFQFQLSSAGLRAGDRLEIEITGFSAPVPEPSVILLMGLGLIGLITTQRHKA